MIYPPISNVFIFESVGRHFYAHLTVVWSLTVLVIHLPMVSFRLGQSLIYRHCVQMRTLCVPTDEGNLLSHFG
jgi:hypothetical protein